MSHLATFLVGVLLALGIGSFVIVLAVATWRHIKWRGRVRRRIGWYT